MTQHGKVKSFNGEKGLGLIRPDGGGPDVQVHVGDIQGQRGFRTLEEGQKVTYDLRQGPKGAQAENVKIIH